MVPSCGKHEERIDTDLDVCFFSQWYAAILGSDLRRGSHILHVVLVYASVGLLNGINDLSIVSASRHVMVK